MTTKTRKSLLAVCLSMILVAGVTLAASPVVVVGRVRAPQSGGALMARQFEQTVHDSVSRLDTTKVKGGPYVISATLVRITSDKGDYGVQATAVVKTAVHDEGEGTLIGASEGRATAAAPGGSSSDARNSALRAAIQSALSDVPRALEGR